MNKKPLAFTAESLAAAAGGELTSGDRETAIERFSIDSRAIESGQMFVAIRGERFDGHQFVSAALERGAIGAIVERGFGMTAQGASGSSGAPVLIQVDDTTTALQSIARDVRRQSGARVVAITGSAGKTTTKEVTADFLATRYQVFRNKGNLNNHIGLPLSLLELRSRPDVAIVELGMNHAGEIRTLVGIAEPEVRVWTNVGDAHLGFFTSPDAIADAKAEILENAGPRDALVANADDGRVMTRARRFPGETITFGIERRADVHAYEVRQLGLDGMSATVRTPQGETVLDTPLLGHANLLNVLAATATALHLGVSLDEIRGRAGQLRPATHRGELLRLPGGITVIDDSYNSNPTALRRSLELLAASGGCARKIAVVGEMLELGDHSERLHIECGRAAAAARLDFLVAVGSQPAGALADAAIAAGLSRESVVHAATKEEAAQLALERVRPGDLILVKGSRGIGTDFVVERLRTEFA